MLSEKKSNSNEFWETVDSQIEQFLDCEVVRKLENGSITLVDYHRLLLTLFHQTYSGPYTFSLASSMCEWRHEQAKEYLLEHAEDERTHWRWVLDDLKASGYKGESPRNCHPHWSCQAYIGVNNHLAIEFPLARLAIAVVLEGIGARHGIVYGRKLLEQLELKPEQASFFLSHGETDKKHIEELKDVVGGLVLTDDEWGWMTHSARVAGQLYKGMYDHEGYS